MQQEPTGAEGLRHTASVLLFKSFTAVSDTASTCLLHSPAPGIQTMPLHPNAAFNCLFESTGLFSTLMSAFSPGLLAAVLSDTSCQGAWVIRCAARPHRMNLSFSMARTLFNAKKCYIRLVNEERISPLNPHHHIIRPARAWGEPCWRRIWKQSTQMWSN